MKNMVFITLLVLWTHVSFALGEEGKASQNELQKLNHFDEILASEPKVNREPLLPLLSRFVKNGDDGTNRKRRMEPAGNDENEKGRRNPPTRKHQTKIKKEIKMKKNNRNKKNSRNKKENNINKKENNRNEKRQTSLNPKKKVDRTNKSIIGENEKISSRRMEEKEEENENKSPFSCSLSSFDICSNHGGVIDLSYEQSVHFHSINNKERNCKVIIQSPNRTKISFNCPYFKLYKKGCKTEALIFNSTKITKTGKVIKKRKEFCKKRLPPPREPVFKTNRIEITYRNTLEKGTGIFICRVKTKGGLCALLEIYKELEESLNKLDQLIRQLSEVRIFFDCLLSIVTRNIPSCRRKGVQPLMLQPVVELEALLEEAAQNLNWIPSEISSFFNDIFILLPKTIYVQKDISMNPCYYNLHKFEKDINTDIKNINALNDTLILKEDVILQDKVYTASRIIGLGGILPPDPPPGEISSGSCVVPTPAPIVTTPAPVVTTAAPVVATAAPVVTAAAVVVL